MTEMTTEIGDRFFVTTRAFACSRARLFEAWTTPDELARWWGPKGFTNTFHTCDVRPGGQWVFTMHGPTGGKFENEQIFREVERDTRIVLEHLSQPRYVATVLFTDEGTGSRVRWRMEFETVERFNQVKKFAVPGNEENLDKLEALLAGT
jgi:uncharacterized protein YndB with AHSA1/START domain